MQRWSKNQSSPFKKAHPYTITPSLFYSLLDSSPTQERWIRLKKEGVRFIENIINSSVCLINLLDLQNSSGIILTYMFGVVETWESSLTIH